MLASLVRSPRVHGLWAQSIGPHKISHEIFMFATILVKSSKNYEISRLQ